MSELYQLKRDSIRGGEAKIIGAKTGKPRVIYFTNRAVRSINKYLSLRTDGLENLFCSHEPSGTKQMAYSTLRTIMPRWAKKAGLNIRLHPHAIRKTCATILYNQSNDLLRVQKIMGHERPETTQNYAIVDNLKDFHQRNLGQNHEIYVSKKIGGALKWELKGWVAEGGKVKCVERAIKKAVGEVLK